MTNFTAKTLVLLLSAATASASNPNSSLRAGSRTLQNANASNKKPSMPNRKLQKDIGSRQLQQTSSPTLISATTSPPSFTGPTVDPELCREATALQLGTAVEGTMEGPEGVWYSVTGIDGYLALSTCTGDSALDAIGLDTVITVYSGICDTLTSVAYDDDGGSCGNAKSLAYFQAVAGETYYVNVNPFSFSEEISGLAFGLVASEVDVPVNFECASATPLVLGTPAEGETSNFGNGLWYSVTGTGGDLTITTCTGDNTLDESPFDSVIEVYAKDCDDMRFITSDDEGGKCGNGKSAVILSSVEGLIYQIHVYEYLSSTGSFGLVVSENP